jgi:tRNA A-37 threonylcarbamoyl transferase component Bud32
MSIRLQCSQGHVWEFAHDGQTTLPLGAGSCPFCGRASDQASLADGKVAGGTTGKTSPYREPPPPEHGTDIPGYELLGELGHGGMGVVYKARQRSLNRVVALKMPLAGTQAASDGLERFRAEAETIAGLRHPHILPVFDFGEHDKQPYFSMEFADGGSLERHIAGTLMPPRPAAHLVALLARAVQAAHQAGLVHRDLKPANILLSADGVPKISDFGLAMTVEALSGQGTSGVEGTPTYMAPEQAAGGAEDAVGRPADVYALGGILYRLLTGRPPFQGDSVAETLEQVRRLPPVPPRHLQPAIPRDLEAIVLKCLSKSPTDRYASAADVADDLDRFLAGDPVRARRVPIWGRAGRVARRRPALAALASLLLTLGGGAAWYWHTYRHVAVEYYANLVTRWGAPEGVGRLTADQVAHRGRSYRVYKRAGHVERVESINGSGRLVDRPALSGPLAVTEDISFTNRHVCAFDYQRDEAGRVTDEIARNALGDVVWSFHFTGPDTGHYKDRNNMPFPQVKTGAAFVRFVRTPDGFDQEIRFLDSASRPKQDARGIFGEKREINARGLVVRATSLGADDRPTPSTLGPPVMDLSYDDQGNVTEMAFRDAAGQPAAVRDGYCRFESGYDRWGNLVRVTYFGIDGNRYIRPDGYSEFVMEVDDHGDHVSVECHGNAGRPVRCPDGYARLRIVRDGNSRPTEVRFLDEADRPCKTAAGVSIVQYRYDERGFETDARFFGTDDRPCNCNDGYSRTARVYSDNGRRIETRRFRADGHIFVYTSAVECSVIRFDDRGQEIERRFLTDDGKPMRNSEGYAGWRHLHDENGNIIECSFFDIEGRPCSAINGVARWTARLDPANSELVKTHFDLAGRPLQAAVKIVQVTAGGTAERIGVRVGDLVVTYGGRPVSTSAQFLELREREKPDAAPNDLVVRRGDERVTLPLPPGTVGFRFANYWVPK